MIFLTHKLVFVQKSLDNGVWTGVRRWLLLATVLLLPLCYQARPKPVGRIPKTFFLAPSSQGRSSVPSSALLCVGNLANIHSTQKLLCISLFHARGLRMTSFWVTGTTRFKSVDIICQIWPIRGYSRSWYTRTGCMSKEMITGSAAPSLPSFLPFYFRLCTLSIQRAQLSQSLAQAMQGIAGLIQGPEKGPHKMAAWLHLRQLKNTFLISTFFLTTNDTPFFYLFFFHNCLKNNLKTLSISAIIPKGIIKIHANDCL